MSTPHRVIGTAGHIDHGKTSLVKALTGIDTDRLKEEKERGITIELGFAHLRLPRHGVVGVVDVPGHERFVRTMVAGAVGIDLVVLVVAADEGVMPQTREHLDICELLGIRRGVVALSKCDLVDDELRELAALEVREALRGTFLETAPVVACSARSGAGLADLLAAVDEGLAEVPGKDPGGLLRLPVDRVFSMKGFGTVATGTLWAGRLRVGDELVPLPGGAGAAKVRGLQVHGQPVEEALAGQRTAVNLALPQAALLRGETLVRPGSVAAGLLLDVRLRHLPTCRAALRRRARVLLHAGTAQRQAQVTLLDRGEVPPGGTSLAQIQLDQPLVLQPGDRFILRGFAQQKNYGTTLGGGVVLRTLGARHRRGSPELGAALQRTEAALSRLVGGGAPEAGAEAAAEKTLVELEVGRAGMRGSTLAELLMRLPLLERRLLRALEGLQSAQRVVGIAGAGGEGPTYVSAAALSRVQAAVQAAVAAHHAAHPLQRGLSREELALPPLGGERDAGLGLGEGRPLSPPPRLVHRAVEVLSRAGALVVDRTGPVTLLHLPDHDPQRAQAAQGLIGLGERVLSHYEAAGLAPPRLDEAAAALDLPVARLKEALDLLVQKGRLIRIKDQHFARCSVDELRGRLVAYLRERREITPQQWKEMVGATRKYAIPLAEHFDAERLTLRVGEVRRLRA